MSEQPVPAAVAEPDDRDVEDVIQNHTGDGPGALDELPEDDADDADPEGDDEETVQ